MLVEGDGTVLATATRDHQLRVPRPGWAEHDAEADWWQGLVQVIRGLLGQTGIEPARIAGVGLSAIGPCMLPVDAEGRALMPAVLYGVDTRSAAEVEELTRAIGVETLLSRTGNRLTSQAVGPKILWLKRNRPEVFARAARFVTSTTYLVQRLTGECVIDHYTAGSFTPLYDPHAAAWTTDLTGDLVTPDRLPRLSWSDELAGRVTPEAAAATGLAEGTPVTTGTIDAAAEALSVGVAETGDMMMMYGSTIFIITLTGGPVASESVWSAPWLFRGRHAAMAGQSTAGTLTHWFRETFAPDLPREDAFATLAAEAEASPPGARGVTILPYLSGASTPIYDAGARGMISGLDLTHSRGDLFRAALEGIALNTNHVIEAFAEAGQRPARVLAVGGGVKNRVWLQATSDITGLTQILSRQSVGAALGDALLAAIATGHASEDDVRAWNPEVGRVSPRDIPLYAEKYREFRALYQRTHDIPRAGDPEGAPE